MNFPSRQTSFAATVAATVASALAYPFLPKRVATHFDADGRPDGYGSRAAAAFGFPAMMLGAIVLNDRLGAWPGSGDRENSDSGVIVRDEAVGMVELALLVTHLSVLANGLGVPMDMGRISRGVFGALMIALGNLMPKLPRNGLVGIRTPWTLADPAVWERTHRLGGYLLTAAGLMSLASLPAAGKRAGRLPMAAVLGTIGVSAGYSFIEYARRPRLER